MKKVLVIGDSCLDVFEYGKCRRICPEAPVPVLTPISETQNSGMAANVFENLEGLGVKCAILTNKTLPTKRRIIDEASNQMIVRVDSNDSVEPLDWEILNQIYFADYEAIVVSDYDKGFLDREQLRFISHQHNTVFIDTKKNIDDWILDFFCIKINDKESQENWGFLHEHYHGNLIVTLGKEGAILNYREKFPITNEHPVRDLTGAGDTFIAGLVANYIETKDIKEAIKFANICASWAVSQKGIGVVDNQKITLR